MGIDRDRLRRDWAPTLDLSQQREQARSFSADERRKLAAKGQAMPDGSFPIVTKEDLAAAIKLAQTPAQRKHVMKRAGQLGASAMIPQSWEKSEASEVAFTSAGSITTTNPVWNPVVTTVGARTILTAPATTEQAAMWDARPNPNPHILWMQGRFVGAERPNRNGAFWSTADLELGKPTVAHGPLNWLHEERHIIGVIADSKFVPSVGGPTAESAAETVVDAIVEKAAVTGDPHITALSAVWRWVYPQEASVIQMASDTGVLAYSMECVAEAVQCVGDGGCGTQVSYMAYAQGQACDHLKERASVRRLVNPTFLGGAVIVPPTRPGWADADAAVMTEAAAVAEKAYDQAGRPDIPADTWEQLMAGVLNFAKRPQ